MAVDLDRIGRASLQELGDIRIDDVLSFIDRGIENMPSYMDLYRRWEAQQWAVADIDFTLDRQDWIDASEGDRKATLWSHRLFFNGEERVTATLAPFVWASLDAAGPTTFACEPGTSTFRYAKLKGASAFQLVTPTRRRSIPVWANGMLGKPGVVQTVVPVVKSQIDAVLSLLDQRI